MSKIKMFLHKLFRSSKTACAEDGHLAPVYIVQKCYRKPDREKDIFHSRYVMMKVKRFRPQCPRCGKWLGNWKEFYDTGITSFSAGDSVWNATRYGGFYLIDSWRTYNDPSKPPANEKYEG
ncbi:hypothetical protein M0R72_06520 [Candidatus Pacearchaeota archaeon]|jgi:hypothetical protein|nr:hypothetical protein [Candidatus Pacearchaeota archaeon]